MKMGSTTFLLTASLLAGFALTGCSSTPSPDTGPVSTAAPEEASLPEATKDANAVVLELKVVGAEGNKLDEGARSSAEAAANERIRGSSKLALPTSKGVTTPRNVTATLTIEAPSEGKDGLTQRVLLQGVTSDGRCPLFALDSKLSMSGGKTTNAREVDDLRKMAIGQIIDKLEGSAPGLEPHANCTPESKH